MTISPEPRFAKIASMIGDPTRARMLLALMGGEFLAAGELAAAAGVSAQTASTHIAKLLDAELVVLRTQRQRRQMGAWRRQAAEGGAHLLPACALSADARASRRFAHACFDWSERRDHLAGALAVSLLDHSLDHGWLRRTKDSRALQLTPPGERALARWIRN